MSRPPKILVDEIHDYNINIQTREIYLGPHPMSEEDTDYRMVAYFLKNIDILEQKSKEPILIHQYNFGGFEESLFAIYDRIKSSDCFITILTHGVCASSGTVIIQAADLRLSMKNCYYVVHEGTINTGELTHRQKKSFDDFNNELTKKLYYIYGERCKEAAFFKDNNTTKEEGVIKFLKNKLKEKEDWYLLPEEAKEYGFIDGIVGTKEYPTIEAVKNGKSNS